jgi:hypothetical protein
MEAFVIYHNINKMSKIVYNLTFFTYMFSVVACLSNDLLSGLYLATYICHSLLYMVTLDERKLRTLGDYMILRSTFMYAVMMLALILELIFDKSLITLVNIFVIDLIFLIINHPFI